MQLAREVLRSELQCFEQYFHDAMQSDVPLLTRVLRYVEQQKGKQMRPMFVLLCARLGGAVNARSYRAALLVELLHTASLVHDDLVDDALERRGAPSVNALWKNKTTVMTGDYLFTKSLLLSLGHEDYDVLAIYTRAIGEMIESELLQITKSNKLNFSETGYCQHIYAKTASFLAAACAAGACTTFADKAAVERMHTFGEKVGMAFQLKDDLFDYGTDAVGKPTGNDIKEKKITLPLLYTLQHCEARLKKHLVHILKHAHTDKDQVAYVIAEVKKAGGMEYATTRMMAYRDEALALLHTFPASQVRDALGELVRYTTDRVY